MSSDDTTVSEFLAAMRQARLKPAHLMTADERRAEMAEMRAEVMAGLAEPGIAADKRADLESLVAEIDATGMCPATAGDHASPV